ncbi:MAG: transcriptional repressor [Pseudomonadota bacterium]
MHGTKALQLKPHSDEQQEILQKAKQYCEQTGNRFTPSREKIYKLLLQADGSIGAYDLLDKLKQTDSKAKPPTVYRALDFFLHVGLAHKVESTNTFKACRHFDCAHPVQFLICDYCGDVREIQSKGIRDTLEAQAKQHEFKIKTQTIEAHGICQRCQS